MFFTNLLKHKYGHFVSIMSVSIFYMTSSFRSEDFNDTLLIAASVTFLNTKSYLTNSLRFLIYPHLFLF